ncbi:Beta-1,4-N-acetylgalactosaminyltransferase 3 [Triplophysa tibetana]|uniref:Beta-1,4-N-acetylgalactosaminyltransferase n=1 Tax=Triplophysa tibetana TaxID=1572043 RepID=A0A5A9P3D2_9TELE|nr:Beta-1,4-N-acetylgalactosaminyltransferase 3 [Triplophysa tibetana]
MLNFLPVRKFKRNGKYIVFGAVLMVGFLAAYLELMATGVWSATGVTPQSEDAVWAKSPVGNEVGGNHIRDGHKQYWTSKNKPQKWKPEYKGQVNLHVFEDWCGPSVAQLRKNLHYPLYPHSRITVGKLAVSPSWTNYGLRIFGYIHPYTDGDFKFAVASDDNSEFWLSDDENPDNLKLCTYVGMTGREWTAPGEYGKYASQTSNFITLQMNRKYFFELIHKQDDHGTDHVEVAWQLKQAGSGFSIIDSKYISLYTNESSLKAGDVSHVPQTAASHVAPPHSSSQAPPHGADMLRSDPRDSFHKIPLLDRMRLQGVLPKCSYNPSYIIKGYPLVRYQGLQFVHLSCVYPNDYTRLSHMESENKCFYRSYPYYMERYGFSNFLRMDLPENLKFRGDRMVGQGIKMGRNDNEGLQDSETFKNQKMKVMENDNDLPKYGDDSNDFLPQGLRKLFSVQQHDGQMRNKALDIRPEQIQRDNSPNEMQKQPQPKKYPEEPQYPKTTQKTGKKKRRQKMTAQQNLHYITNSPSEVRNQGHEKDSERIQKNLGMKKISDRQELAQRVDRWRSDVKKLGDQSTNQDGGIEIQPLKVKHNNTSRRDLNRVPVNDGLVPMEKRPKGNESKKIDGVDKPVKVAMLDGAVGNNSAVFDEQKRVDIVDLSRNKAAFMGEHVENSPDTLKVKKTKKLKRDRVKATPLQQLQGKKYEDNKSIVSKDDNRNNVELGKSQNLVHYLTQKPHKPSSHNLTRERDAVAAPPREEYDKDWARFHDDRKGGINEVKDNAIHLSDADVENEEDGDWVAQGFSEEEDYDFINRAVFDVEVNWAQTFQVKPFDLNRMQSDWIDLKCNVSGNLLLSESEAMTVVDAFMKKLNRKYPSQFSLHRIVNIEKRSDYPRGSRYLLELDLSEASGHHLRLVDYIYVKSVDDWGSQQKTEKLTLCYPSGFFWNPTATVHFIIPVKNQARWVQQFISDMEELYRTTGDQNFNIIITDYESTDIDIEQALQNSVVPRYQYLSLSGNFERSAGLQAGIDLITDDHSIVFLCDLHIHFPPGFIDTVRKHCVEGHMAFAPIVLRLNCGASPLEPDGYWEINGFGLMGIYKSDLDSIGGMNTKEFTDRWGGEDWELLDRILQGGLEVDRLYLRNFFHHFHSKRGMWNRQMLRNT